MDRRTFVRVLAAAFWLGPSAAWARMAGGGMGCGMGHGMGGDLAIPESLPAPSSREWVDGLAGLLELERLSLVRYQTDSARYGLRMPYMMVIGDERNHVSWIGRLFTAYGLQGPDKVPDVDPSPSASEAYQVAMGMEAELIPAYERLIESAQDEDTARILGVGLAQTRRHYMMFGHVANMGFMGHGMGQGMMF